jgi:hypothetical protein
MPNKAAFYLARSVVGNLTQSRSADDPVLIDATAEASRSATITGASDRLCSSGADGVLDPDRSTYFFTSDGQVYKAPRYCASGNPGDGTPITPPSQKTLGEVLSSPDGTQVVFQMKGAVGVEDKVFVVDGNGASPPRQITNSLADILANSSFFRWQ